jgi:transposase
VTGHLIPDFKTIVDFRKDNGEAIRRVCRAFIVLCQRLDLLCDASVAIDGSKFKAVNARDRSSIRLIVRVRQCRRSGDFGMFPYFSSFQSRQCA